MPTEINKKRGAKPRKSLGNKTTSRILAETKQMLTEPDNFSSNTLAPLEKLSKMKSINEQKSPENFYTMQEFMDSSKEQIADLTNRIVLIENTLSETKKKKNHLTNACATMINERDLTKLLIKNHHETMFVLDKKLEDLVQSVPTSNKEIGHSNLRRRVSHLLNPMTDEVLLKMRIAKLETQISQRSRLLQSINKELSEVIVALDFETAISDNSNQVLESIRGIRFGIMRNTRQFREQISEKELEKSQHEVIKTFFENLNKGHLEVNNAISNLKNFMLEAKNTATDMTLKLQKLQSSAMYPNLVSQQLDKKVSELILKKNNK